MHPRRRLPPITTPQAGTTATQGAIPCTLGAVSPLTAALRKSNRRRGSATAHPQRNSPRPRPQLAGQPPPICCRGRISARPRQQLPHQAAAQHRPTDTEGAAQYTLGANHPSHDTPGGSNRHPRRNPAHPRRKLSPPSSSQHHPTAAEGATQRALGANYPQPRHPKREQPPLRERHSAPSAPITPNHDTQGRSNHRPRRIIMHPRHS